MRVMGIEALVPRPGTSKAAPGAKIYPKRRDFYPRSVQHALIFLGGAPIRIGGFPTLRQRSPAFDALHLKVCFPNSTLSVWLRAHPFKTLPVNVQ